MNRKEAINSPECSGCLTCISYCPTKHALDTALPKKAVLNPMIFVSGVIFIFFGIILAAKLIGKWHSSLTYEELLSLIPIIHTLTHPWHPTS